MRVRSPPRALGSVGLREPDSSARGPGLGRDRLASVLLLGRVSVRSAGKESAMSNISNVRVNTGAERPIGGFGVYQVPPDETEGVVSNALEVGYRHFDTAASYQNEGAVGRALASSGVPRDELFVTTKLWIQSQPAEPNTKAALEESLQPLGPEHADLYLTHHPPGQHGRAT